MHWLYELLLGPGQPIWISDLSNLTVFGLLVTGISVYKQHNCTEKGCWRLGHHPVEGTTYKTCHHHTTREVHARLHADHAKSRPEQHKLLNPIPKGHNP